MKLYELYEIRRLFLKHINAHICSNEDNIHAPVNLYLFYKFIITKVVITEESANLCKSNIKRLSPELSTALKPLTLYEQLASCSEKAPSDFSINSDSSSIFG
jgi:hypothetical protein